MMRPILEYACTVWSPYTQSNIDLIESVQRKATSFICNDYFYLSSVTTMLQQLNWPQLERRRWTIKAMVMYKITHNLVAILPNDYMTLSNSCTRNHHHHFRQFTAHINSYLCSFFPSTIKIWNDLPDVVINASSVDEFKSYIFNLL